MKDYLQSMHNKWLDKWLDKWLAGIFCLTSLCTGLFYSSIVAADQEEFVIAVSSRALSIDPHFHSSQPDFTLAWNVYQPLAIDNPETSTLDFLLLDEITPIDVSNWRLIIKPGIKFHDGAEVTAKDVVHSFERAMEHPDYPGGNSPMRVHMLHVKEVRYVNDQELHIITDTENANIAHALSRIMIVKAPAGGSFGDKDSFNSGKNAIGTGPFRFVRLAANGDYLLERFDHYQGKPPMLNKVRMRYIKDKAERLKAFQEGRVQLIEKLLPDDIIALRKQVSFNVSSAETYRTQFMMFNAGDTPKYVFDLEGNPLRKNPFADLRVRQAVAKAIDRKYLLQEILGLDVEPAKDFTLPVTQSKPDREGVLVYDPDTAKKLLADAGYVDGFRLTIHGPNDRYIRDSVILEAIAGMLSRIGIKTKAESIPKTEFFPRWEKFEFALSFLGLSATGDNLQMLQFFFQNNEKRSNFNVSDFDNPELDNLLDKASRTPAPAERRVYLREVSQRGFRQMTVIPLYLEPAIWGVREGYEYIANPFERTLAQDVIIIR